MKPASKKRVSQRIIAYSMRVEGKSLKVIADFLGIDKEKVNLLIKECQRLEGVDLPVRGGRAEV